jgi:hypothetical protein
MELVGCGFRQETPEHLNDRDLEIIESCEYECETVSCEVCSAVHDSDSSDWTLVNECEVVCKGCQTSDQVMTKLNTADDFFKSKDASELDLKEYEELECLFCDSSGFGSSWELALTKDQAIKRVQAILDTAEETLYSAITGVGQFQVYVSIFRKI